jgi:hypothetical protein
MQSSSIRRRLPQLTFIFAALLVGVFLSNGSVPGTQAIGTFNYTNQTALCSPTWPGVNATDPICSDGAGAIATNTVADLTTKLSIGATDYNFSSVVTTVPASSFVAAGPGNPAHVGGTDPALGDILGQLISDTNLGLTNGACNTTLNVPFTFINATVDNSGGNLVYPISQAAAGSLGTIESMSSDDGSAAGASPAGVAQAPVNGLPAAVDRYPNYLNSIFDPDFESYGADGIPSGSQYNTDGADVNGGTAPVQPLARIRGGQVVSGTAVTLDLLVFSPGALSAAFARPHPFADLSADMGYTTVTVLQNPTAAAAPGAITDFCAGLNTMTTVYGESRANPCNGVTTAPCNSTGGINGPAVGANLGNDRMRTPASAGNYLYIGYSASLRDADGDGFENGFDTCATTATPAFNPRVAGGAGIGGANDPDADGIPGGGGAGGCDPTTGTDTGSGNHDGDTAPNGGGWLNAGDNCPLVVNGTQVEAELTLLYSNPSATNPAPQGGPKTDAMGDACDAAPGVANGDYLSSIYLEAKCIGGTDGDDDGWCTAAGAGVAAADPSDGSSAVTPEDYDLVFTLQGAQASAGDNPPERQPIQVCNDGIDNDGDTLVDNLDQSSGNSTCRPAAVTGHPGFPACPVAGCALDSDGDGATDEVERHVGTNPYARCGVGAVPALSNAWAVDFTSAGVPTSTDKIVITDLTSFLAPAPSKLGTAPGGAGFNVRWDLVPGPAVGSAWIQIGDLTALIAGSNGFPPMTSGAKVFGGAVCTAHPITGN